MIGVMVTLFAWHGFLLGVSVGIVWLIFAEGASDGSDGSASRALVSRGTGRDAEQRRGGLAVQGVLVQGTGRKDVRGHRAVSGQR